MTEFEIIGAILVLSGWALFLCFLIKSPARGSGWISIELTGWMLFAVWVMAVRHHGVKGIPVAGLGLSFSVPLLLAPLFIVLAVFSVSTDLLAYARFWFIGMTVIVTLLFSIVLITSDDRSDFRWPFYCWPISNLLVAVGLLLL